MDDLNLDGMLDAVVVLMDLGQMFIDRGQANRQFQLVANPSAGCLPRFAATVDYNSDGMADVVLANDNPAAVTLALQTGPFVFAPIVSHTFGANDSVLDPCARDRNQDGFGDFAVNNSNSNAIELFFGNASGVLGNPIHIPASSKLYCGNGALAADDLNGDGTMDLLSNNPAVYEIAPLSGDGLGGFSSAASYPTTGLGQMGEPVDMELDGRLDLVSADDSSGTLRIPRNRGDGSFDPVQTVDAGAGGNNDIAAGDFNGDGVRDLAVTKQTNQISIVVASGFMTFGPPVLYATGQDATWIAVADLDGPGRDGIVMSQMSSSALYMFLADSHGGLLPPLFLPVSSPLRGSMATPRCS
jgi:hypothetical protein